jgi:hypothetical protein
MTGNPLVALQSFLVQISFPGVQKTENVSRSSTETEYKVMTNATTEVMCVQSILRIWASHLPKPLNSSVITWVHNILPRTLCFMST